MNGEKIEFGKIDNISKKEGPDSQILMWSQLSDLKSKLEREGDTMERSPNFSGSEVDRTIENRNEFLPGYQNLKETAGWYEMDVDEFLKDKIEGKDVLDVGSSRSSFAREAKAKVECNIVSIDIDKSAIRDKEPAVVARGEALPFKDESFDEVFATFSLPYWAMAEEQVDDFFKEAVRVLKVGGNLNIAPIVTIQNREYGITNLYISNKVQIEVINVLEEMKENPNLVIRLSRNLKSAPERDKERLKEYAPTLVTITKIK